MKFRPQFNAPVTITLALLSIAAVGLSSVLPGLNALLAAPANLTPWNPLFYTGLFTHIIPHASWTHFWGNFSFILLIGPLLEQVHGSSRILWLIVITALLTALLNAIFFSTGLIGASGIVFMFIILGSFAGSDGKGIPITFILLFGIYMTKEIVGAIQDDNISQFAHLMGGGCGATFGFFLNGKNKSNP